MCVQNAHIGNHFTAPILLLCYFNLVLYLIKEDQTFCCDRKIDATAANATITPDSTTVVTLRWGFNRFYSKSTPESLGFNPATLALPASLVAETPNLAFPAITMGGAVSGCSTASTSDYTGFGGGCTNQDVFYSRSFNATVSKFLGKHTVKGGFDFLHRIPFGVRSRAPGGIRGSGSKRTHHRDRGCPI
jgi:hypothetical protein